MQNVLDSVIEDAGKAIVQARMVEQFPDLPNDAEVKANCEEKFKSKYEGSKKQISDDIKRKQAEAREKISSAIESGKQKAIDAINNVGEQCKQALEEVKADLSDLGTAAGLLTVGTLDFLSRIAMVPPAIISATPMGPGVSTNLVPPMLKDLMAEGNQLSKQYDDCTSKMNKLGLERLASIGKSRSSSDLLGSVSINFGVISSISSSFISPAMSAAKPLILAVGASVGGESGSEPEVEAPISIDYKATDCSNFAYINAPSTPDDPGDISVGNCLNFLAMIEKENADGTDATEKSCNNCKNYLKRT